MALLICKKCKKLITSNVEPCPYCGEVNEGGPQRDLSPKGVSIRNAGMGFFVLAVLLILLFQWTSGGTKAIPAAGTNAPASAAPGKPSCLSSDCPTGTKAVTNTTPQDPFYLCKSDGLSEYANFVLNVMIKQDRYAEIVPSAKTGELALQGNDKLLLDKYRAKAGAASFEDALSKCYRGLGGEKVVVLYSPADSSSIYVADAEVPDNKFWLPKARLLRQ